MDRCWGIPVEQEHRLEAEISTPSAPERRAEPPRARVLGKRHAATSPAGLDEVLNMHGGRRERGGEGAAARSTKSDAVQAVAGVKPHPPRQRKRRKSTHMVRKEEKERLLKEMEVLNAQLAGLKQQAMASMGNIDRDTARSMQLGCELRDDVHVNQQKFGEIASIISEFSICNAHAGSPLHDTIRLQSDRESRKRILRAMKVSKMPKAEHFLKLRRPNTNLRNVCDEGRRFEMDSGDFFSERLTITQFRDARSVKQIYDLLIFYYCNLEISISEKIGHITVREDDDNGNKSITQNRLVSNTVRGLKVESNTITFAQFHERGEDKGRPEEGNYGIIAMDYVDHDEKYPYQPQTRLRKDIVAVMEVRECTCSPGDDRTMVVLTRWVQNKLHRPSFPISLKDWHELRDRMDLFGKTMQQTLAEDLRVEALGLGRPCN